MVDDKTVEAAARALLNAAPPGSRVILFGSAAKGTSRPDSDLDFLVIEPTVEDWFEETFHLRKAVGVAFAGAIQPVDLIVTDEEHFLECKDTSCMLAFEAASGGRIFE